MRVLHAKPEAYDHRRRLRRSEMPNLRVFGSPPTLAKTTTTEVTDEAIGMPFDYIAQRQAERFIRCALAFHRNEEAKAEKKRAFQPSAVLIALPAEEADEIEEVADVATVLAEQVKPLSFEDLQ